MPASAAQLSAAGSPPPAPAVRAAAPAPPRPVFSAADFISAVTGGPAAVAELRARLLALPLPDTIRGLAVEVIDPELVRIIVGAEHAPDWVTALARIYARVRAAHPAQFLDVDYAWKRQRSHWVRALRRQQARPAPAGSVSASGSGGSGGSGAAPADRRPASPPVPPVRPGSSAAAPAVSPPLAVSSPPAAARPAAASASSAQAAPQLRRPRPGSASGSAAASASGGGSGGGGGGGGGGGRGSSSRLRAVPAGTARRPGLVSAASPYAAIIEAMLASPSGLRKLRSDWVSTGGGVSEWDLFVVPADLTGLLRARSSPSR